MTHVVIERPEGKLLRAFVHPANDSDHPGELEIRILSADYFGNHIRRVEQRAYFTEQEIGDVLEALVYKRIIEREEEKKDEPHATQ